MIFSVWDSVQGEDCFNRLLYPIIKAHDNFRIPVFTHPSHPTTIGAITAVSTAFSPIPIPENAPAVWFT